LEFSLKLAAILAGPAAADELQDQMLARV
jgi:hypothetical protein